MRLDAACGIDLGAHDRRTMEACSAETLDLVVTVCDDAPPSAAAG